MKIHLKEMVFYGFHGVHSEEKVLGQRFLVNFTFETDYRNDPKILKLDDTIDYTLIYAEIKQVMENKNYDLLENCANEILDLIMQKHSDIVVATIKIAKPSVPIQGPLAGVELEMTRTR